MNDEYKGPLTKAVEKALATQQQSEADSDQRLYDATEMDIDRAVEALLRGCSENVRIAAINVLGTMRQEQRAAYQANKYAAVRVRA